MQYQDLVILLPCHSLEDFPTYHDGEDADENASAQLRQVLPQVV